MTEPTTPGGWGYFFPEWLVWEGVGIYLRSNRTVIPDPYELARLIKWKRDLDILAAIILHKKPSEGP